MPRVLLLILVVCTAAAAQERHGVKCAEDSPERRGGEGCTILASRPLMGSLTTALYWHIDRFDSLEEARKAAGPDGVAAEAHDAAWLMTVEAKSDGRHDGHHVAWIGPLALAAADGSSMRVQSSLLEPGSTTPAHAHSGPEVIYVVDGEQCMETPEVGHRLGRGQSLVIPAGLVHRGRVIGSGARRAFGLVLHDPGRPASHDLSDPPSLTRCK